MSLWVKSGSVCLAHQSNLDRDRFLHTEAPSTSTHKVRPEAYAGLPRLRGQPWLQWEALWQQQQQKVNKLGQALNKCHSLTPLHPHFAQTTYPCPFKSGERLWFPPPTVKGRAWRSLAELRSFEHVGARVVLSDWSEGLLLQRAFRVICRPGARRSVPGACTFHSQAGPGAPGSCSLRPRVGVFTPGSRYGCSARGGPGSPSPGRDTRP